MAKYVRGDCKACEGRYLVAEGELACNLCGDNIKTGKKLTVKPVAKKKAAPKKAATKVIKPDVDTQLADTAPAE